MRGVRDQNLLARAALRVRQIGANQQQSGQFALRAGGGLERSGVHPRDFGEAIEQQLLNFQAALRQLLRLIGMLGGDAVEARDKFIHARVVLHRARPERIHAQIDRVIPRGKPREMADDFDFADFGESRNLLAGVVRAQRRLRVHGRHIERREFDAALAGRRLFEDQPFVLADVAASFLDAIGQSKFSSNLYGLYDFHFTCFCSARLQAGTADSRTCSPEDERYITPALVFRQRAQAPRR